MTDLAKEMNDFDEKQVIPEKELIEFFQDYNGIIRYLHQHGPEKLQRRLSLLGHEVVIRMLMEAWAKDEDSIEKLKIKNDALQQEVISNKGYIESIQGREMESVKRFFEKDKMMHEVVLTINEALKSLNNQQATIELLSTTVVAALKNEREQKNEFKKLNKEIQALHKMSKEWK